MEVKFFGTKWREEVLNDANECACARDVSGRPRRMVLIKVNGDRIVSHRAGQINLLLLVNLNLSTLTHIEQ